MNDISTLAKNFAMPEIPRSMSPAREISPNIWWLPNCFLLPLQGSVTHLHNAPYLILGEDQTLLWDTSIPTLWDQLEPVLAELLGGRDLDWVVPSHPEVAHAGNLARLLAKYPNARVFGDVRDYHVYFPDLVDRLVPAEIGSELDLGGGYRFTLVEGLIKDLPSTQWGYEASQQVLFVGDGFAYSHQPPAEGDERPTHSPDQCTSFAGELDRPPVEDQIVWITKAALYWTRFVDMDVLRPELDEMLRRHPTRLMAPAHGAVIDDVDGILPIIWDALKLALDPELGIQQAGSNVGQAN